LLFINVWRSIDEENPVLTCLLAVCDARTVPEEDRICYDMRFPNRRGENYALRFNDKHHKWFMHSRMTFSKECLAFTVFDRVEPIFVFHTAFTDRGEAFYRLCKNRLKFERLPFSMILASTDASNMIAASGTALLVSGSNTGG